MFVKLKKIGLKKDEQKSVNPEMKVNRMNDCSCRVC